jgi:hypothetical protein
MPGAPCPVCAFPTHAWRAGAVAEEIARAIREDAPAWSPESGLCERCADVYELRTGAVAASRSEP